MGWTGGGGGCSLLGELCFSRKLFKRPVRLCFLFSSLARRDAALIWSLWRSRKLLAVVAAVCASWRETVEGSLWKEWAVLRACCFWAQVVPWEGGGLWVFVGRDGEGDLVFRFVNLCCRLLIWLLLLLAVGVVDVAGEVEEWLFSFSQGFDWLPMPKPGTDIPDLPRRLMEP